MSRLLLVADAPWVRNEVHAALTGPDDEIVELTDPRVAATMAYDEAVDAVIADLQVGSMGGMAVARAVRDAAALSDERRLPVVMLLDRAADGFLARRAGADAWLTKPLTSAQLRTALDRALAVDRADLGLVVADDTRG